MKPSCKTEVTTGMKIETDTPRIREEVTHRLQSLLHCHPDDCMTCPADGDCEFQSLIRRYNVTDDHLRALREVNEGGWDSYGPVRSVGACSPALEFDFDRCIKCGRCAYVCSDVQLMNVLEYVGKGRDRRMGFSPDGSCIECGQCVVVCPTGALFERQEWRQVLDLLDSKRAGRVLVVQTAPATRVALGEGFGMSPGTTTTGQMVSALRQLGFDYVFDTNVGADLTIVEESAELLQHLGEEGGATGALPMFTSCCPGWINFVEKDHPELRAHLSTCKVRLIIMLYTVYIYIYRYI